MKRVATQLSDAGMVTSTMKAHLSEVLSLDGARNPEASLREVSAAIAAHQHLGLILDDLRARYVGASLAQTRKATE